MRSKTHGLDKNPVREGEFRWVWYKLIPTNVKITAFRLEERRHSFSVKGALPSAAAFGAFTGTAADFTYEFSASFSYSLDENSLVSLVERHSITGQDQLTAFEDNLSGEIGGFIQSRMASDPSYAEALAEILGGRASFLEKDIQAAFPYVKNFSCVVNSAVLPDFALYRQLRGLYEEYLARQKTYLSSVLNQDAESRIDSRLRFDELERYGELLTRYPILIQYLSLEKGLIIPEGPDVFRVTPP
jgi:hypothetical protein